VVAVVVMVVVVMVVVVVVVVVVVKIFVAVAAPIFGEKIIGKRGSGGAYYCGKFHGGTSTEYSLRF
jgi:hypothetical protein